MNIRVIAASLFAAGLGPGAGAQTYYFAGGGSIPDGGSAAGTFGQPRVMTVSSNATNPIQDVVLSIGMNHTYVGDLRIRLSFTPAGSITSVSATVIDRVGAASPTEYGSNHNINGVFTFAPGGNSFNTAALAFDNLTYGVYAPFKNNLNNTFPVVEFADVFRGLSGTGVWTLTFEDGAALGVGTVTSASIGVQARPLPCLADFNTDGVVNTADLTFFLGRFGGACP